MENASTATADVVQQIKHMLVDDLQLNVKPDEIPDDSSLLEDGLALDSIAIAELIAQIEDRFGLQFDDQVLDTTLFANLSVLAAFVRESLAVKGSGNRAEE
jgi:acyl carrier protein